MNSKLAAAMALVIVMVFGSIGYCDSPDSFRGIPWETNLSEYPGMKILDKPKKVDGVTTFTRNTDGNMIGSAEIKKIVYYSFGDKFYSALISVEGVDNFLVLGRTFYEKFKDAGIKDNKCIANNKYVYIRFNDEIVDINGSYNQKTGRGAIVLTYNKINQEALKYKIDQGKEGVGDL